MLNTLLSITVWDIVDITIVAFIIYRIILLVKGTRAEQMLLGLAMIIIIYFLSQWGGLLTLRWVLNNFLSSIIIIIIVIFQDDIRRALAHIGRPTLFDVYEKAEKIYELEEITKAAFSLARDRIGAIIVLEKGIGLRDYVEIGTEIDAKVGDEILTIIFHPSSSIHDGAVIIQRGRIVAAGCILPLSTSPHLHKSLGTRHRAAVGITEETDALAVVVSEERGEVSIVSGGLIKQNLDLPTFRKILQGAFVPVNPSYKGKNRRKFLRLKY